MKEEKSQEITLLNLKFIHKLLNSVNTSLLILIFILFFLSFNSQRNWSNIYQSLSRTKAYNNNLIDYISKTEESYIGELESLENFKKTTPSDLIYFDKSPQPELSNLNKKIKIIIKGLKDSKYQVGY